jgi:tRNA pseudouridine38-40 synthase
MKKHRVVLAVVLLFLCRAGAAFVAPGAPGAPRASSAAAAAPPPQHRQPLTSALLGLSYDGRRFSGWTAGNDAVPDTVSKGDALRSRNRPTRPDGVVSVAGVLQCALARLYGMPTERHRIVVEGSSRTDKGVHARGAVAHVYAVTPDWNLTSTSSRSRWPGKRLPHPRNATDAAAFLPLPLHGNLDKLAFTLNQMLPPDIRVMRVAALPSPFHASQSATAKTYRYRLRFPGGAYDPLGARTTWQVRGNATVVINEDALQQAMDLLTNGPHHFGAFAGAPRGASDKAKRAQQNTTCHVSRITCQPEAHLPGLWEAPPRENQEYVVTLTGDRFLYKMVRFLVGSLVAVALGHMTVDDLRHMLESGERRCAFVCAPAHGLTLEEVHYEHHEIDWRIASS